MDVSGPGLTYILLVIPLLIAFAVMGQGASKIMRQEPGGTVILGFGVVFVGIIAAAYFLFIR